MMSLVGYDRIELLWPECGEPWPVLPIPFPVALVFILSLSQCLNATDHYIGVASVRIGLLNAHGEAGVLAERIGSLIAKLFAVDQE